MFSVPKRSTVQIPNYEKVVVAAVDQKLRELRTLKQHYYPEVRPIKKKQKKTEKTEH